MQPEQHWRALPPPPAAPADVLRELDAGLVLRRASEADAEALAAFNAAAHADPPAFEPDRGVERWTRELMDGRHPRMRAPEFTLVEDTKQRCIASSLCLIPHRFRYEGVTLEAGQVELVGTRPGYRRRGLVAAQFEWIHRRAAERGQLLQVIDGIPWYYRQFGYEMALENGGGRVASPAHLDADPPAGALRVRACEPRDLPFLLQAHDDAASRSVLSCVRDESFCRYELLGRDVGSARHRVFQVVAAPRGRPRAVFAHLPRLLRGVLVVTLVETLGDARYPEVLPALLHALRRSALADANRRGVTFAGVLFRLGSAHPCYDWVHSRLPDVRAPYAWYVRVPDLPAFLMRVAPALEARLARSSAAGSSGRVELNLYRSGLRLQLEHGRLVAVERWQPSTEERGDVAFPDLTFLQLLFGRRSLEELEAAWPDCLVHRNRGRALVSALFPKRPSQLDPTD